MHLEPSLNDGQQTEIKFDWSNKLNFYKVLPTFLLFKISDQFVNEKDYENIYDKSDLDLLSQVVNGFRRMNYNIETSLKFKMFNAYFLCIVSKFLYKSDDEILNEILNTLFSTDADRTVPVNLINSYRSVFCHLLSSYLVQNKFSKFEKQFTDLLDYQMIEFEDERFVDHSIKPIYDEVAMHNDLIKIVLENIDYVSMNRFNQLLENADQVLNEKSEKVMLKNVMSLEQACLNRSKNVESDEEDNETEEMFQSPCSNHSKSKSNVSTTKTANSSKKKEPTRLKNIKQKRKLFTDNFLLNDAEESVSDDVDMAIDDQTTKHFHEPLLENNSNKEKKSEADTKSDVEPEDVDDMIADDDTVKPKQSKKLTRSSSIDSELSELDFDESPNITKKKTPTSLTKSTPHKRTATKSTDSASLVIKNVNKRFKRRAPQPATLDQNDSDIEENEIKLSKTTRRKMWTDQETTYLCAGIEIHGVGNWRAILNEFPDKFNNRTTINLRDKYRNLERFGALKMYEKQGRILLNKLKSKNNNLNMLRNFTTKKNRIVDAECNQDGHDAKEESGEEEVVSDNRNSANNKIDTEDDDEQEREMDKIELPEIEA